MIPIKLRTSIFLKFEVGTYANRNKGKTVKVGFSEDDVETFSCKFWDLRLRSCKTSA